VRSPGQFSNVSTWRRLCYGRGHMEPLERRKAARRAVARGGRRLEDWLPVSARPCGCGAEAARVGTGRQFIWCRCAACGSIWALQKDARASRPLVEA
jgi:hypothetical protein